jgi:lysozyme
MTLNAIIDISHHNGAGLDFAKAKAAGTLGVIHKATQGLGYKDPQYDKNKSAALKAGLWWGAYHFATGDDPRKQADFFLKSIGDQDDTLLILDFEHNPAGSSMDINGSHAFVTYLNEKRGKFPGLYAGSYMKELLKDKDDAVLANCWFWLAQYGAKATVPSTWPTWTMWQYTDGGLGPDPHSVDGIGRCDRSLFNGNAEQLQALWSQAIH